jgi:hypothetical protein
MFVDFRTGLVAILSQQDLVCQILAPGPHLGSIRSASRGPFESAAAKPWHWVRFRRLPRLSPDEAHDVAVSDGLTREILHAENTGGSQVLVLNEGCQADGAVSLPSTRHMAPNLGDQ